MIIISTDMGCPWNYYRHGFLGATYTSVVQTMLDQQFDGRLKNESAN